MVGLILSFLLQITVPILDEAVIQASLAPDFEYLNVISSPEALMYATGEDVTVAIIDTGLDISHPQYANTIVTGHNIISGTNDFVDECGHGTSVAGPLTNVAPDAELLVVKVFNSNCKAAWYYIEKAIIYAVDNGAKVINLSLSGTCLMENDPLQDIVNYAYERNVTVVAAMGNYGDDVKRCPARLEHVIAVGATDENSYPYNKSSMGEWIDVVTPGNSIWVPFIDWHDEYGYDYIPLSGTSLSSPQVAGMAALLYQIKPDITADEVIEIIQVTAKDINKFPETSVGFDIKTGYGMAQVYDAVRLLIERYDLLDELGFEPTFIPFVRAAYDPLP